MYHIQKEMIGRQQGIWPSDKTEGSTIALIDLHLSSFSQNGAELLTHEELLDACLFLT